MANMTYCAFENTAPDMEDCVAKILDTSTIDDLPREERNAAKHLYDMACEYIDIYESLTA